MFSATTPDPPFYRESSKSLPHAILDSDDSDSDVSMQEPLSRFSGRIPQYSESESDEELEADFSGTVHTVPTQGISIKLHDILEMAHMNINNSGGVI